MSGLFNTIQSTLAPHGPAAHRIAFVIIWVVAAFAVVSVVMWLLLAWVGFRRRGTFAEHAPWTDTGNKTWIFVGGLLIPIVTFSIVFAVSLRTMSAFPIHDHADGLPSVRVVGHQWWWDVQYLSGTASQLVRTANEIHIPAGRPVDIELITRDVIHSLWVPGLHGKVDLLPGVVNHIRVQADRPGIYQGECAEFCGVQHAHMRLVVSADAPADYDTWLARERSDAAEPADADALSGQQQFLSKQCVLCHTVRGTPAHGGIGPDLTHVGSRGRIAANSFPNNTAYLEAWVTHAQSLKPGVQMPNVTSFTGEELHQLVAYLQSLK